MSNSDKGGRDSDPDHPNDDLPQGITITDHDGGKGKPPRDTRWKPGCASPNPKGRTPKPKPGKRDLAYFLNQKVVLSTERGPETYTKGELGYLAIANHWGKGTPWAIKLVLQHDAARHGGKQIDPLLFDPKLTDEIVRAMEEEIRNGGSGSGATPDDGGES